MSAETNVQTPAQPDPALPPSQGTNDNRSTTSAAAAANLPIDGNMASSKSSSPLGIPLDLHTYVSETDKAIVRLNSVLNSPGGLTAFLGTANYALYIIAHAQTIAPSRAELIGSLSRLVGRTPAKMPPGAVKPSAQAAAAVVPSPVLNLALTLADTRTTLRLTGLIPLYCLLKALVRSQKDPNRDTVLHSIAIGKCLAFMGFQALENIHHLTNKAVLSPNIANRITGGQPAKVMTYACRSWLAAITLDFLRLLRERQLNGGGAAGGEKQLTAEEKKAKDQKWWTEFLVNTSWYPMALHYAVDGGVGLNVGMVGLCGFFAYVGRFQDSWAAAAK